MSQCDEKQNADFDLRSETPSTLNYRLMMLSHQNSKSHCSDFHYMFKNDLSENYIGKDSDVMSYLYMEENGFDDLGDNCMADADWVKLSASNQNERSDNLSLYLNELMYSESKINKPVDGCKDSNNMNNSESSSNLIKEPAKKAKAVWRLTSSELEFFDQLYVKELEKQPISKRFSCIDTDKSRAWEHIHKHSNNLNISENEKALSEIISLKKTQNLYLKKGSISIADTASSFADPETASDTLSNCSKIKKSVKISPSSVNKRIIRMFLRHYKTTLEWGIKSLNVNLSKQAWRMSKASFNELIITFMDRYFENRLDLLDEQQIDKIIQSLSLILLKDRYCYFKNKNWVQDKITADLDFDELSNLAYNPNYEKTLRFISQEGNAVLYWLFFLLESQRLALKSSEAFCYKEASQLEETKVLFFQMHELYNESIAFAPKQLQKTINDEVNQYLKEIDL